MNLAIQPYDQALLVLSLAAYVTGALVLIAFFLTRLPMMRSLGVPLAIVGCVAQFAELGTRWAMTGVWPLTNLYGSLSLFSAVGVLVYLIFAKRYGLWFIGGGVLAVAAIALGYATTWNEGYMPAVPALQSYWIKIHVPIVISSYASFMVAFVVSLIYLLKAAVENRLQASASQTASGTVGPAGAQMRVAMASSTESPYGTSSRSRVNVFARQGETPAIDAAAARGDFLAQWMETLPSLSALDLAAYRIIAVGVVLLAIGIITGAMWAKEAWGAYWQWDPKETAALVSFIIYAAYLHLHTRRDFRGTPVAWVSVIGFVSIVFCYLGVNIWISGLHSYKM
jgi:cytochrome c-type biogenesis protein CcsB